MTGSYGRCGTAIIDHLHDRKEYAFTYFNRSDRPDDHPYDGYNTVVGNVTDYDALSMASEGQDAMIHLAAYPYTDGAWEDVEAPNVRGVYNALEAAREHFGSESETTGGAADPMAIDYSKHRRNIDIFLDAIESDEPYPLDAREARKAVEIIEAIYESADRGEPVQLE